MAGAAGIFGVVVGGVAPSSENGGGQTPSSRRLSDKLKEKFHGDLPEDAKKAILEVDQGGCMALRIKKVIDGDTKRGEGRLEDPPDFLVWVDFALAGVLGKVVWKYGIDRSREMIREMHSELCAEIQRKRDELVAKYGLGG